MVFGMATTKVTITLRDDQLEKIRALVAAGHAANVSAFVHTPSELLSSMPLAGARCSTMRCARPVAR
jgi:hypothetical protein